MTDTNQDGPTPLPRTPLPWWYDRDTDHGSPLFYAGERGDRSTPVIAMMTDSKNPGSEDYFMCEDSDMAYVEQAVNGYAALQERLEAADHAYRGAAARIEDLEQETNNLESSMMFERSRAEAAERLNGEMGEALLSALNDLHMQDQGVKFDRNYSKQRLRSLINRVPGLIEAAGKEPK